MTSVSYRPASLEDIPFLVGAIAEAERSGTNRSMYERAFALDPAEQQSLFESLLREEIPGSEFFHESFLVALIDDVRAGCLAAWREGAVGRPSNLTRATMLSYALGSERWQSGQPVLQLLSPIDIPRSDGALQLESIYVAPSFRGHRLVSGLIEEVLARHKREQPDLELAQILTVDGNDTAGRAFGHAGFTVQKRTRSDDPRLVELFPGSGRLLWERRL